MPSFLDDQIMLIDLASRSHLQQGSISTIARRLRESLVSCAREGRPAVILFRKSAAHAAWRSLLRGWSPQVTKHCVCMYDHARKNIHLQIHSYSTGLLVSTRSCIRHDQSENLPRSEADALGSESVHQCIMTWIVNDMISEDQSDRCWVPAATEPGIDDDPPALTEEATRPNPSVDGPHQPPDSARYAEKQYVTQPGYSDNAKSCPTDAKER